jgi:hypothetical protein
MIRMEEAEVGFVISGSDDESVYSDFSYDIGTNETDVGRHGDDEPMYMDVEHCEEDPPNAAAFSATKDETTSDTEDDFVMEVDEESNGAVDEETCDVLDLEKLYELLEQSKRAGDLIAGKNVILLIGGTGAGKVSFFCFFSIHNDVLSVLTFAPVLLHFNSDDNYAVS